MRKIFNKLGVTVALVGLLTLVSCVDDPQEFKHVDVRQIADDNYTLAHTDAKPISIVVKSSDPWVVYNYNQGWCHISPENGVADLKTDIVIQYKDNTELDDRIDTLVIQSDYWISKWITVLQKGTAFLNIDDPNLHIGADGGDDSFNITSNQNWTTKLPDDINWLTMSTDAGFVNGKVTFDADPNMGEQRVAQVSVFDRNKKLVVDADGMELKVEVVQEGIVLIPNELKIQAPYKSNDVEIEVESNVKWKVVKDDPTVGWYSFNKIEFSGNETLVVSLDENVGQSVLKTTFTIETDAGDGYGVVRRVIDLRQAYLPNVTVNEFSSTELGNWNQVSGVISSLNSDLTLTGATRLERMNLEPGVYTFNVNSMTSDAGLRMFFKWGDFLGTGMEARWHLFAASGKGEISLSPYSIEAITPAFSYNQLNKIQLRIEDAGNGYTTLSWYLNGGFVFTIPLQFIGDVYVEKYPSNFAIILMSDGGTTGIDSWEFMDTIDWGKYE